MRIPLNFTILPVHPELCIRTMPGAPPIFRRLAEGG